MLITKKWLKSHNACSEGIEYCEHEGLIGLSAGVFAEKLIDANKLDWSNWLVAHALEKIDKVRYAAHAAEEVLPVYEEKYPDDDRPRKAIESANAYINNPCARAATDAAYANAAAAAANAAVAGAADAAYAAYAAADAADAARAARVATYAARVADAAVYVAYVADAARAARVAAYAANAAVAAHNVDYIRIIKYGINLLKEAENE